MTTIGNSFGENPPKIHAKMTSAEIAEFVNYLDSKDGAVDGKIKLSVFEEEVNGREYSGVDAQITTEEAEAAIVSMLQNLERYKIGKTKKPNMGITYSSVYSTKVADAMTIAKPLTEGNLSLTDLKACVEAELERRTSDTSNDKNVAQLGSIVNLQDLTIEELEAILDKINNLKSVSSGDKTE